MFSQPSVGTLIPGILAQDPEEIEGLIVQLLAKRSYCLPYNSWFEDWKQFFRNTHPLLGICFQHELHPCTVYDRVVFLVASSSFGLIATSSVVLGFHFSEQEPETVVHQFSNDVKITYGLIALWTFGGALHSIFDITLWYITTMPCCLRGGKCSSLGLAWIGSYISIAITVAAYGLAMFTIGVRVTVIEDVDGDGVADQGIKSFSFLLLYLIELCMALFCFNPLIGTVLFTGILGCYRIPVLGGRPFHTKEMDRNLQKIKRKLENEKNAQTNNCNGKKVLAYLKPNDGDELELVPSSDYSTASETSSTLVLTGGDGSFELVSPSSVESPSKLEIWI